MEQPEAIIEFIKYLEYKNLKQEFGIVLQRNDTSIDEYLNSVQPINFIRGICPRVPVWEVANYEWQIKFKEYINYKKN